MASLADTEANSRPAIFSVSNPGNGEDDPGVALVAPGQSRRTGCRGTMVLLGPDPHRAELGGYRRGRVDYPSLGVGAVLSPRPGEEPGVRRLREQDILRSLVVGAAVLRSLGQGAEQATAVEELTLTTDDYEQVRRLLQSPLVAPADETCDPLAKDMVNRANVFLQAKYAEPNAQDNPFNVDGADSPPGSGANRDLITRREVADLGNVRSRLVRQLVEFRSPSQRRLRAIPADGPDAAATAAGWLAERGNRSAGGLLASLDGQAGPHAFRPVAAQRHDHGRA